MVHATIAGRPVPTWIRQTSWLLVMAVSLAVIFRFEQLPFEARASGDALAVSDPARTEALAAAEPTPTGPVMLELDRSMRHGDYVWNEEGVPEGRIDILVDIGTQTLQVFRANHEIGRAVILYGTDGNPTPLGRFTITQKNIDHESNIYDAKMPFMMRLTNDGIAIHGTIVEYGKASRGCIGVPDEFAALLFEQARLGDRVRIIHSGNPNPASVSTVS